MASLIFSHCGIIIRHSTMSTSSAFLKPSPAGDAGPQPQVFHPKALFEAYPHLNRNNLHFWSRKMDPERFQGVPVGKRKGRNGEVAVVNLYGEDKLPLIAILNRCYHLGLSVEQIQRALGDHSLLRRFASPELLALGVSLLETLICLPSKEIAKAILDEAREITGCARVWLFQQTDEGGRNIQWRRVEVSASKAEDEKAITLAEGVFEQLIQQLTDESRTAGRAVNLFGSTLARYCSRWAEGLRLHSVLAVPVAVSTPRSALRFWLVAENKLDSRKLPNSAAVFDVLDETALELIARYYVACWRTKAIEGLQEAARDSRTVMSVREMLRRVLDVAANATGAFRGDVTIWDTSAQAVKIWMAYGSRNPKFDEKTPLPNPSISRWVLEHREERYAPDTANDIFYLPFDDRTKSELAIPITNRQTRAVEAVLNLESDRADGFADQDRMIARACADVASQWADLVFMKDDIVSRLFAQRAVPQRPSQLDLLPKEIATEFGYQQTLIYLADHRNACLSVRVPRNISFSYSLDQRALATKVYKEGVAYFCPDENNDLFISHKGRHFFDIRGPILTVPLKCGNLLIGVVALWGNTDPTVPTDRFISELETFIANYASGASGHDFEVATDAICALQKKLREANAEADMIDLILRATQDTGLDRARLFHLVDPGTNTYECVGSIGDNSQNQLAGTCIPDCQYGARVYAERIYDAHRFDPAGDTSPNAEVLLRPPDLQYAHVPLWYGKDLLLGCLAGDNKHTRNRITKLHLHSIELIASVAGPALAGIWEPRSSPDRRTAKARQSERE
jgi:GAF domain-containing protein